MPVDTRSLEGKSQFLCASGAPCLSLHSTFCRDRFDRPFTCPGPPPRVFVLLCLWISRNLFGTSVFTSSSGPGNSTSICEPRASRGMMSSAGLAPAAAPLAPAPPAPPACSPSSTMSPPFGGSAATTKRCPRGRRPRRARCWPREAASTKSPAAAAAAQGDLGAPLLSPCCPCRRRSAPAGGPGRHVRGGCRGASLRWGRQYPTVAQRLENRVASTSLQSSVRPGRRKATGRRSAGRPRSTPGGSGGAKAIPAARAPRANGPRKGGRHRGGRPVQP
mmetsp:Transcript_99850/g.317001  ORF Transcript_99850/g.317001 Transcript_99850/m.317001 type:complete len:276 (+) Transcript_99850:993-1820(+)